ncbi:hypothetical protein QTN25_007776 [Entamoeba marina]
MSILDDTQWVRIQQSVFLNWINSILNEKGVQLNNVKSELTPEILKLVAEVLTKKKMKVNLRPSKSRIFVINNFFEIINFLKENDIDIGCSAENLADNMLNQSDNLNEENIKYVLGALHSMYRKSFILKEKENNTSGKDISHLKMENLIWNWVKHTIQPYGISTDTILNSFCNGELISALDDAYLNNNCYNTLYPLPKEERLLQAFEIANKMLGIEKLFSTKELMEENIDERAMTLYMSLFYQTFKSKELTTKELEDKKTMDWEIVKKKDFKKELNDSTSQHVDKYKEDNVKQKEMDEINKLNKENERMKNELAKERIKFQQTEKELEEGKKKQNELDKKLKDLENENYQLGREFLQNQPYDVSDTFDKKYTADEVDQSNSNKNYFHDQYLQNDQAKYEINDPVQLTEESSYETSSIQETTPRYEYSNQQIPDDESLHYLTTTEQQPNYYNNPQQLGNGYFNQNPINGQMLTQPQYNPGCINQNPLIQSSPIYSNYPPQQYNAGYLNQNPMIQPSPIYTNYPQQRFNTSYVNQNPMMQPSPMHSGYYGNTQPHGMY